MKKISMFITLLLVAQLVNAQQKAVNTVSYMITFDQAKATYTAWLVPSYNTPNFNNPEVEERGATAQFSIKVPKDFVMRGFKNLKGEWDGNATKIGSQPYFVDAGVNTNLDYYIIGKTPTETNYGIFTEGEPVALFSFQGSTSDPKSVDVLDSRDEFVSISTKKLALNVAPSFYSRSGQAPQADARPLEQFTNRTTLKEVLDGLAKKNGIPESFLVEENDPAKEVLLYPNPAVDIVNVKYFSNLVDAEARIDLLDISGSLLQSKNEVTKLGFNNSSVDISSKSAGTYMIRVMIGNDALIKKVVKTN
jgi:hypothetical protein